MTRKVLNNLSEDVDEVEDFAEDELEDVGVVSPQVAGEVVDDQGPAILHRFGICEGRLIHTLDDQAQFAAWNRQTISCHLKCRVMFYF